MSDNPTTVNGKDNDEVLTLRLSISYCPGTGDLQVNADRSVLADPLLYYGLLKLAEKSYDGARAKAAIEKASNTSAPLIHTV